MPELDLKKLFFPRAFGIIGVNEKTYGGGYFLRCLKAINFTKPLFIFNPRLKGQVLEGIKVHGSISEISDDQQIDHVILAVPAKFCASILEEIGKKKIPFVTIFSSGFSEVGNTDLEQEILEIANKYNIRIIGPNCLGVYNPKSRLATSRWHTADAGNLGLISQSGGLSINLSNMAIYTYGTNISKMISIGNQIDLNVVDFLKYFLTDNDTKIVGLYLENLKGKGQQTGKEFIKIVKSLSLKGKPVILWKVGFGESTRDAIFSHTGGMAGSTRIWRAITKQTGAILVQDSVELISLAMGFNYLNIREIDINLGIAAIGGGSSIELTEQMEIYDLKVPELHPDTKNKFKEFLPDVNTIIRNPLDLGGSGMVTEIFTKTLITIDSDPNISIVIFIKPYYFTEEFLNGIIKAKSEMKKPLICIANKIIDDLDEYENKLKFKKELFKKGIPVFESIEMTAKALDRMNKFKKFLERQKNYNKKEVNKNKENREK
ncbi:MAG: CoA-binding protein [Promethearchaeota archaeon]